MDRGIGWLIVCAAVLFSAAIAAAGSLDMGRPRYDEPQAPVFLLPTGQLTALAGDFGPFLADMYWIRVVGTPQEALRGNAGSESLYELLDRITALDPDFEPPFQYGALMLSIVARRPDLADRISRRAERHYPNKWEYPFYQGFNCFYHRLDFLGAARHLERAAAIPGAPPYLGALAKRFRAQEHSKEAAMAVIRRMIHVMDDPVLKERLEERLRELEALPA